MRLGFACLLSTFVTPFLQGMAQQRVLESNLPDATGQWGVYLSPSWDVRVSRVNFIEPIYDLA